jgi:hypothetical protein
MSSAQLKGKFEQAIKEAAPKVHKASWKATGNSGGQSGEGKFKKRFVNNIQNSGSSIFDLFSPTSSVL